MNLAESQAVNELAEILYDFLPATPHPYANPALSYKGVAASIKLDKYWTGGSKKPAISMLLSNVLKYERGLFCNLIIEIVRNSLVYRQNKAPLTREEITAMNLVIQKIGFKVPDLWDTNFLNSLPSNSAKTAQPEKTIASPNLAELSKELIQLSRLEPQKRGFQFEKFLHQIFTAFELGPRSSFRLVGEQIDGSLDLDGDTYLIEAKWTGTPTSQSELLIFQGKVDGKSSWSRGIFISYSGFTSDGIEAFSKGRSTKLISLTGEDLHFVLNGDIHLKELLKLKARRAAETGEFHVRAYDLIGQKS